MLEVVFGQNVDISLMMAQRYGEGPFPEGRLPGFMFYGDKEPSQEEKEKLYSDYLAKEREKWENTVPLGGNRNDIYGFDLILDIGELRDAEWSQYAALQTLIEPEEIQFYASQWEALREADAPLRVVTDGCVLSATDDFYDEAIWQEIEKQEGDFYQTKLIGRLLDQRIGIRDSWISYRFDCFLDAGRLELVAVDHECSWIRILRKRG